MAPGHPTGYDGVEGLGVASHPCSDTGKIGTRGAAQDTNMFSLCREGESCSIHHDGVDIQPVFSRLVPLGLEKEELGLLHNIYHTSGGGEGL